MREQQKNWAENFAYRAEAYHYPETIEQVQGLVARSKRIKTLGARHSFNKIADTDGDLISLDQMDQAMTLDRSQSAVTVGAAVKYGQVGLSWTPARTGPTAL